jgi:predicted metal-dependent hydrolase
MDEVAGLKKSPGSLAGLGFEFAVARSARRKTLSIEVRAAKVTVRAPLATSTAFLLGFLQQKAAWVRAKIAEQQALIAARPVAPDYRQGSVIAFMDERLVLVIGRGSRSAIARRGNELHLLLSARVRKTEQEQIRALLARWFQQHALQILMHKTTAVCARAGLRCSSVSVKATRSKWGHCTSKGAIQYNWQILLAPEAIVDYLVAHEVSHLRHQNHSADFWALVASLCPTCKADRAWLKANGASLSL